MERIPTPFCGETWSMPPVPARWSSGSWLFASTGDRGSRFYCWRTIVKPCLKKCEAASNNWIALISSCSPWKSTKKADHRNNELKWISELWDCTLRKHHYRLSRDIVMNKTIIALLFMLSATLGTTAALATDNQEKGRNMENIELTSAWDKLNNFFRTSLK